MTSNNGQWARDDLPHAQWLHDTFYDKPDSAMDALERIAVDLVDHLNAHHPKPEPYDQGGVRGADSLLCLAERERDAAVARAEAAEARVREVEARPWTIALDDKASPVFMPAVTRDEIATVLERADSDTSHGDEVTYSDMADAVLRLLSGDDPAVHVVRESDLPAARVDGDYYVVASAKGDYKWPQHGPSWWAGRAQDALAEAARYTSLARLAADREAVVDPVEELAEQIETATRAAIRQACDDLAGVVPALDPLAVEQAMEVTAASRKVAAHVLGQEAGDE